MAVLLNELNYTGVEVPLSFVKGTFIDIGLEIVDELGVAVNISGRVYTCKIGPKGQAAIATFTQVNTDLINGLVNLTLDSDSIAVGNYRWIAWENNNRLLWRGPVVITDPEVL